MDEGWVVEEVEDEDDGEDGVKGEKVDSRRRWRLRRSAVAVAMTDTTTNLPGNLSAKKDQPRDTTTSSQAFYLSAEYPSIHKNTPPTLRTDSLRSSPSTHLIIRMQSRFKPSDQVAAATKSHAKISRRELEDAVGRRLNDDEVKRLKRARRDGTYHEEILDVRVKGKHDKFAS